MKLAVNYSKETEELIQEGAIQVDMFKCPDFSDELIKQAESTKRSYIHFDLNAGSGQMGEVNWERIKYLKKNTNTPYINVHAVAYAKDFPNVDVLTTDQTDIKKIIHAVVHDIEMLAEKVGAENIILENVICRGKGDYMMRPIIEPAVISEIIGQTGCGLLLDIAHAQMTSMCLGFDVKDYISQLPLEHLKELHITGIQYHDESRRLRDSMPMTEDDWNLASWSLKQIKAGNWPEPWVVAFEYGGVGPIFEWRTDKKVLAEQLPVLYNLVK